jgi:Toprim domain
MNDSATIDNALRASAEALVSHFRGQPNKALSSKSQLRWGNKGSLAAVIAGKDKGRITDFEAGIGKGMSPFQFIAAELGTDIAGAFCFARNWLGMGDGRPVPTVRALPSIALVKGTTDKQRAGKVAALVAKRQPIAGTPGERYLNNRGIMAREWPDCIGWLPKTWGGMIDGAHIGGGAVVFIATDAHTNRQAVQLVHVTEEGQKAPNNLVHGVVKRTHGSLAGAAVQFPAMPDRDGPVVLAEGPETALSVWLATGLETRACLGISNIGKAPVLAGATVIIARDADKPGSPADKAVAKAAEALIERGCRVVIAKPQNEGTDFNDVLQADGKAVVRHLIEGAVPYAPEAVPPSYPLPTRHISDIAATVSDATANFFRDVAARIAANDDHSHRPPLQVGIIADCAAGKSRAVILASRANAGGSVSCG